MTGVQTCALPISRHASIRSPPAHQCSPLRDHSADMTFQPLSETARAIPASAALAMAAPVFHRPRTSARASAVPMMVRTSPGHGGRLHEVDGDPAVLVGRRRSLLEGARPAGGQGEHRGEQPSHDHERSRPRPMVGVGVRRIRDEVGTVARRREREEPVGVAVGVHLFRAGPGHAPILAVRGVGGQWLRRRACGFGRRFHRFRRGGAPTGASAVAS